jgi:selenocysteine lyase/cysteine desulfurase
MNHPSLDLDAEMPIRRQMTFLNHAGVAPISARAAETLRRYADHAAQRAYIGAGWHAHLKKIKQDAASLINARGGHEIAFISNTSTGLAQVAEGLPWQSGDNVVITNVEYPANRYPWENLKRRGVQVIEVPQREDGRIEVEDVCHAVTDRTRVVAISHVQYASGHRIDLKPIARTVHRAGGYLCVDAIQSVGTMPVDVQEVGVDFLAADGHKWMLGPEGAGFFYCREDLCEKLHPAVVGWMNMVDATDFANYRFQVQPDARRFEPGSYNVPGLLAMGASIELLLEMGLERIWQHIEANTARLVEGLTAKGYRIFSPREEEDERSAIVIFEPPETAPAPEKIIQQLAQQQIHIVTRAGRLRASPHFYNTADQMKQLVDALPG